MFPAIISIWQYLEAVGACFPKESTTDGYLPFPTNENPKATECLLRSYRACWLQTEFWKKKVLGITVFYFGKSASNVAKYIPQSFAKYWLLWTTSKLHWTSTARRFFFFFWTDGQRHNISLCTCCRQCDDLLFHCPLETKCCFFPCILH